MQLISDKKKEDKRLSLDILGLYVHAWLQLTRWTMINDNIKTYEQIGT